MSRRSRRAATIDAEAASQDAARTLAAPVRNEALFSAIKSKLESGTDAWFVIPFIGMNNEDSEKEYGNFTASKRVLSKMLGVDGDAFARTLIGKDVCGVRGKLAQHLYIENKFRVKAICMRNKVVLINFNLDADTDYKRNGGLEGDVPEFCAQPISDAKNAIEPGKAMSRQQIHSFIDALKSSAIEDKASKIYQSIVQVSGISSRPIEEFLLQSILGQSETSCKETPSSSSETSPSVIEALETDVIASNSIGDKLAVDTSQRRCVGDTPMVSPLSSEANFGAKTADTKVVNTDETRLDLYDRRQECVRILHPKKGSDTIEQLKKYPHVVEWVSDEDKEQKTRVRHVTDEVRNVEAVLHATCAQDVKTAGKVLHGLLNQNQLLEAECFSNYRGKDLARVTSLASLNDEDRRGSELVADGIKQFSEAIYSKGSKWKAEQQAQDAINTASVYAAIDEKDFKAIKKLLGMTHPALVKAKHRAAAMKDRKLSSTERVQTYVHEVRAKRSDSKFEPARPYVETFCHSDKYDRATKVDTGENRLVRVINAKGEVESHPMRRVEEYAGPTMKKLYQFWSKSDEAAAFKNDHPKLGKIGIRLFSQLVCRCIRFSEESFCADTIMSGLEEARSAIQNALKSKHFKEAIKVCQCKFHCNERERGSIFLRRGEDLLELTLCPKQPRPELTRKPYPGKESESKEKIPKLHSLDCIHGNCQSERKCGIDEIFSMIGECPLFRPPADAADDDGGHGEAYPIVEDEDGEDERLASIDEDGENENDEEELSDSDLNSDSSTGEDGENENDEEELSDSDLNSDSSIDEDGENENDEEELSDSDLNSDSSTGEDGESENDEEELNDGDLDPDATSANRTSPASDEVQTECDWRDVIGGGCKAPSGTPLGSTCGLCNTKTHHICYEKYCGPSLDEIVTRCSKCVRPQVQRTESDALQDRHTRLYKVKVWEAKLIERTDRLQDELVEKRMTISELMNHLKKCVAEARSHFVTFRTVEQCFDCIKYNTLPEHRRVIFFTDFMANPDLRAKRTACGNVATHAAVEIFIGYEYTTESETNAESETVTSTKVTKRCHYFIGSAASVGKSNNWQFDTACRKHLINEYQSRRDESDSILEFVYITDRCVTQYLCRQAYLQMAKISSDEGPHIEKRFYACKSRFKGEHDGKGSDLMKAIREAVLQGFMATTPLEFYMTARAVLDRTDMNEEGVENHLDERRVYYVAYSEEEYNELNQGDHEGSIVQADMDIQDDTDPIHAIKTIYEAIGLKDFEPSSLDDFVDWEAISNELSEIEREEHDCDDNTFMESFVDESCTAAELARYAFVNIDRRLLDEDEVDDHEFFETCRKNAQHKSEKADEEFLCEFLTRCGKIKLPKQVAALESNINKWLDATRVVRLYGQRSTEQLQAWHKKRFPTGKPPNVKKKIVEDILGLEFPKLPASSQTALQLYRTAYRDDAKKRNPDKTRKEINEILKNDFEQLCEDEEQSRLWSEKEQRDVERYNEEMDAFNAGNPDDEVYYMKRQNMPCACGPGLSNYPSEFCVCPHKKYVQQKIIRMKVKQNEATNNCDENIGSD